MSTVPPPGDPRSLDPGAPEEREAALNRLTASNMASLEAQKRHWARTAAQATQEREACDNQIHAMTKGKTAPPEDEDTERFEALSRRRLELERLEIVASEMLDRIDLVHTGDEYARGPDEETQDGASPGRDAQNGAGAEPDDGARKALSLGSAKGLVDPQPG